MLYELIKTTADYVVLNKPAGLIVHGAKHIKEQALIEILIKKFPEIAKIGDDPARPGIMHRLDKQVSGLMVIARNQDSFDSLKTQFQKRTVSKYYTALVYGRIEKDKEVINFPISRSVKGHKMTALPPTNRGEINTAGRNAQTIFWVKKNYINYTLLKVQIKTGRTHQVRVHLAAYGYPLVGDDLYGNKKSKLKNKKFNLDRIFLVADELEFSDLRGQRQKFKIDLPEDLKNILKIIK